MDLQFLTAYLTTFFLAILPVSELRGSIPFAIQILKLSPLEAFFWSVLGNIVPVLLIMCLLGPISNFLMEKSKFLNCLFTGLFEKTRQKHTKKFAELGYLFLVTFVAIPLPATGGWTASLIAFLFGVPYLRAVGLISLGIVISGIIVTAGMESIIKILRFF